MIEDLLSVYGVTVDDGKEERNAFVWISCDVVFKRKSRDGWVIE